MLPVVWLATTFLLATTQSRIRVFAGKTESILRADIGVARFKPPHESGSRGPVSISISRKLLTDGKAQTMRIVGTPGSNDFVQVIRGFEATPFWEGYQPYDLPAARRKKFSWSRGKDIQPDIWDVGVGIILPIVNKVLDGKEKNCDDICKNHEMESAFMRNCFEGHSGGCCEALHGSGGWDVGGCDCGPKVSCNLLPFDANPTFQGCGLALPICK